MTKRQADRQILTDRQTQTGAFAFFKYRLHFPTFFPDSQSAVQRGVDVRDGGSLGKRVVRVRRPALLHHFHPGMARSFPRSTYQIRKFPVQAKANPRAQK